ncbi:MAG: rubrerythrin family protein [Bacteroidia bacterium]|nr:rubrerythrin family protein [Bacteroidia bacterium]
MGKSIKGSLTEQNLLKAFAGESQAKNRYEFFAEKAKEEGYEQLAAIFGKTALQEQSHAKQFFKFLEGGALEIKTTFATGIADQTIDNLKTAINEENNERAILYPQFSEIAKEEGFPAIAAIFKMIAKVEAEHEKRFKKLLNGIVEGTIFHREKPVRWECRKCGYVHEGTEPPQVCPACQHPKGYFEEMAENY